MDFKKIKNTAEETAHIDLEYKNKQAKIKEVYGSKENILSLTLSLFKTLIDNNSITFDELDDIYNDIFKKEIAMKRKRKLLIDYLFGNEEEDN